MLAGQEILRVLGHAPGHRLSLLGRARGELFVTRLFLRPVPLWADALVSERVVAGRDLGPELSGELGAALDGYRVRARLGPAAGLPDVVAAGVSRAIPRGPPVPMNIALPAADYGYAYVTARFVEGTPLPLARPGLAHPDKLAILDSILRLLACLHEHRVLHGALGPDSMVTAGRDAWLIDLAPLRIDRSAGARSAGAPDVALSADVLALGRIAAWLLETELAQAQELPAAPGIAWWSEAIAACCREDPSRRPGAALLLRASLRAAPIPEEESGPAAVPGRALLGQPAPPPACREEPCPGASAPPAPQVPPGAQTVFVPEGDAVASRLAPAAEGDVGGSRTVFVPDEDAAAGPRSRPDEARPDLHLRARPPRLAVVLAAAALAAAAIAVGVTAARRRAEPDSPPALAAGGRSPERRPASDDDRGRDTPIEVEPRCTFRAGRGDLGTLTVTCRLTNPSTTPARVRITAIHSGGAGPRPIGSQEVSLGAGERAVRRFRASARPEDLAGSRCDCDVETWR